MSNPESSVRSSKYKNPTRHDGAPSMIPSRQADLIGSPETKSKLRLTPGELPDDSISSSYFHLRNTSQSGIAAAAAAAVAAAPFYGEKQHNIRVLSNPSTPVRFTGPSPSRSPYELTKNPPNIVTVSDVHKKRLVDQFFASDSQPLSKVQSSHELYKLLQSPILTASPSDLINFPEDTVEDIPDEITDEDFTRIMNNGGFEFHASSNRLVDDEDLTSYILNIDRTFEEWEKREKKLLQLSMNFDGTSLKPLRELLESFTLILLINAKTLMLQDEGHHVESLRQLSKLRRYLEELLRRTKAMLDQFMNQKDEIKVKFRAEVNYNISRLNELLVELNKLEVQLNSLKLSINENKVLISKDMPEKLKTIEYINKRCREYSVSENNKRFRHLNIILAILIMVISIYYGYR
jgi:hypothetical protein